MSIADRLVRVIKRDTGIDVHPPESINRGHWRQDGVVRWQCTGLDGQRYQCEDSMTICVKHGVDSRIRRPVQSWFHELYFDVNLTSRAFLKLKNRS